MVASTAAEAPLSSQTLLPDVIARHPGTRGVFDRYGLSGCGGRLGPVETIAFFARAHGVEETQLLAELQSAIASPPAQSKTANPKSQIEDSLYRRFFTAGIWLVLTAGATWGAWILWKIGIGHSFTAATSIHGINAHGQAQIYGWLGLFVMGFAYQAFPRIWHTRLAWPRLAVAAFVAMVAGIIVRSTGMALHDQSGLAIPLAVAGGVLEVAAILAFVAQMLLTFGRSEVKVEPYVGFVIAALFWFAAMSVWDVWHTWTTMSAVTQEQLLWHVATYQAPLRDMQVHGVALMIILGVCQRLLPGLYEVTRTPNRRAWWAQGILNAAVLGEVALFVGYRWTNNHVLAAALMLPWLMLVAGAGIVVWPWRLWRPFHGADRSVKFIRTGYLWLGISLVMLLMLPVYQSWYTHHIGTLHGFSHAYYGAIRHAITVGFVSLMIMGFAAKVVPTLNGRDTKALSALWGPFILINLGCALRVSLQTLTDWDPRFYAVIGISGTLEVIALAWWGGHLLRIMHAGKVEQMESCDSPTAARPSRIEPQHLVADVLAWWPQTEAVFVEQGFTLLAQPMMRKTLARGVSLARAAAMRGVDLEGLLAALNTAVAEQGTVVRLTVKGR